MGSDGSTAPEAMRSRQHSAASRVMGSWYYCTTFLKSKTKSV
jgi:hypothetical protein